MNKGLLSLVALLLSLYVNGQTGTFSTIDFPNTYTNTITTGLYTSNNRSGFIHQSNASINYGLFGPKSTGFKFRWLAHDNGNIDYTTDTDQLMFLDNTGNLNMKGTLTTGGNVGIGTAPGADKVTIDMGTTRSAINMISDGDAAAYSDMKFSIKTTTGLASGKPNMWLISLRKDGYFTNDLTGPTLEFYCTRAITGGYFAPLLFKANGDVILAGARNAVNGNVGIGTTDTKGYKLAVNGDAMFTRIQVKAFANWPDYVFRESYKLMSLQELEAYVKENNHLPEVPSVKEIQKEGINVADMNAILLKKIEELTLHLIEQDKRNKEQEMEIATLKEKMLQLGTK
ncbi:hypothetical protein [Chitinophaga ginsengisoli]|uniref:Tail fiber domain-containing protein n=1 Tax=Chitinophaga ginsengisoli TaxID=363837 RepID=A0A2P8FXM0_9BACT|nr:hypothetical protein [Chitinophaga ginsengisoli]PSL26462.1 hypothetical protein CLV42_111176 [Chitinophaga ginsengisoli]